MPHLVMQFQNSPVRRPMYRGSGPMAYAESDMRKYLVKVSDPEDPKYPDEGNFTEGLILAGVPMGKDIIWAPNREISNTAQDGVDPIKDKLWIATEWEIWGFGLRSNHTLENQTNQAFLEYYLEAREIKKYNKSPSNASYWAASPVVNNSSACCILFNNNSTSTAVGSTGDVVPAFCVK
ncbi:MAG: hypothetical protein LBV68_07210 [Spirochaetaceae bacterium]|nr:hypothetical protein [Spirochaetaceae bacterium]